MINRVDVDGQTLFDPSRQLWILWVDRVGHDAYWCTAVELFEAIENRAQIGFVVPGISHVIDRKDDDCIDTFFADPLWRRQFGEVLTYVVRITGVIEVGKSVTRCLRPSSLRAPKDCGAQDYRTQY